MKPKSFKFTPVFVALFAMLLVAMSQPIMGKNIVAAQTVSIEDLVFAGPESINSDTAQLQSTGEDEFFGNQPNPAGAKLESFNFSSDKSKLLVHGTVVTMTSDVAISGVSFDKITQQRPGLPGQRIDWSDSTEQFASNPTFTVEFTISYGNSGLPFCSQDDIVTMSLTEVKQVETEIYAAYDAGKNFFSPRGVLLGAFHWKRCEVRTQTTPTPTPSPTSPTVTPEPTTPPNLPVCTDEQIQEGFRIEDGKCVFKVFAPLGGHFARISEPTPTPVPCAATTFVITYVNAAGQKVTLNPSETIVYTFEPSETFDVASPCGENLVWIIENFGGEESNGSIPTWFKMVTRTDGSVFWQGNGPAKWSFRLDNGGDYKAIKLTPTGPKVILRGQPN